MSLFNMEKCVLRKDTEHRRLRIVHLLHSFGTWGMEKRQLKALKPDVVVAIECILNQNARDPGAAPYPAMNSGLPAGMAGVGPPFTGTDFSKKLREQGFHRQLFPNRYVYSSEKKKPGGWLEKVVDGDDLPFR